MCNESMFDVYDHEDGMFTVGYGPASWLLTQGELDDLHSALSEYCSVCGEEDEDVECVLEKRVRELERAVFVKKG